MIEWKANTPLFLERMVEYAGAALSVHTKTAHITVVTHVSPGCDCEGHSDAPICQDIGVLASTDPVAIDQAGLDLVNQAPPSTRARFQKGWCPATTSSWPCTRTSTAAMPWPMQSGWAWAVATIVC